MTEVVEEIRNGDKRAEILYDEHADDPRSWYNHIGKMVCMHNRYKLGDEQLSSDDFDCWEQVGNYLTEERDAKVILPLYLYASFWYYHAVPDHLMTDGILEWLDLFMWIVQHAYGSLERILILLKLSRN